MSLQSVAAALPSDRLHPHYTGTAGNANTTSIYSSKDPVRLSSLNDVSQTSAGLAEQSPGKARNRPRSATTIDTSRVHSHSDLDTAHLGSGARSVSGSCTPTRRRAPPLPPSKKLSINSNGSATWSGSDDGSAASSPATMHPSAAGGPPANGSGMGRSVSADRLAEPIMPIIAPLAGNEDLVKEGAKGVPPPIIEVSPAPARPGWITFGE